MDDYSSKSHNAEIKKYKKELAEYVKEIPAILEDARKFKKMLATVDLTGARYSKYGQKNSREFKMAAMAHPPY